MRHQRGLLAGVVVAIVAFASALGVSDSQLLSNVGLIAAPALAAGACWWRRSASTGRMRRSWALLGAGCASWCLGQVAWTWQESVQGREVPFPSVADVGYLGAVPLLAAGLMALPTASSRAVGLARTILDGLIIAASVLLVSWIVVLDRVADVDDDELGRLIGFAYPVTDVVIITLALFALSRARRARGLDVRTLGLLVVGLVGFAVADSGFAYLTASDDYASGSLIDVGWFACFLLVALAAARPPGRDHDPQAAGGSSATYPLLPALPVLVAAALLAVDEVGGGHDEFAGLIGALLLVLVVLRGGVFALENQALTRELEDRVAARTQELMRSEDTLRLLIEGVADHAIFLVDADGAIASWNAGAQRLFGYEPDVVLGRTVDWLSAKPLDLSPLLDEVRRVGVLELEGPHRRADSQPFDATVVMTATYGSGVPGPFEGAVVVVRDVTAQRAAVAQAEELAQQLRQKQRLEAVGQLAGGVAHDFNNLLTVISGTVELLPDAVAAGQPIDGDVAAIAEAAGRAAALTRQLLTFSRRGAVDVEVLDVGDVVAGVEELLRRSLGGHVALVVAAPRGHHVVADRSQLEQVLVNLAVNARDAMPRGGTVTVSLAATDGDDAGLDPSSSPEGFVCLTVADDGEGMPEEVQARAFEPFFTTKPTGKGTGLGLATVYGIVTVLGGVVRIDSELGMGTAVRCYLPASTAALGPSGAPATVGGADGRQRTVLVVEDETAVRTLTERLLVRAGFRVLTAPDGTSAMESVQAETTLDLVLTDVVMPGMNGRELGAMVRATRPRTPVLFMSGHTAGLLDGDDLDGEPGVLAKPFTSEELLRAVTAAMEASVAAPAE